MALALTTSPAVVSGSGTSTTTASFTPAAGSLLVALACVGNPPGTATLTTGTVTDSLGSTWTRKVRQNSTAGVGVAEVWMLDAGASPSARTVTLTGSKAGVLLSVLVFTGAAANASQTGATSTSAATGSTISITPTATGSYIVGSYSDSLVAYNLTAAAATTALGFLNDATNGGTYGAWRSTSLTASTSAQTFGFTTGTAYETEKVAAEVLAAAAGSTSATGDIASGTGTAYAATGSSPGATTANADVTTDAAGTAYDITAITPGAATAALAAGTGTAYGATASTTSVTSTAFGVLVDWNGDGDFSDVGEDVTARVRGSVGLSYGRDMGAPSAPMVAGRGQFDLDNRSRDYSPRNTGSPLYGNVVPARPVKITRSVSGTTFVLFRGHTDDTPINPDLSAKTVTLNLVDYLADMRGITVTTPLYRGIRAGDAIGYVLDAAGWTGPRDLDAGASVFPWWWEDGTDAADALGRILASEGPPAMLTVDTSGGIVFRDRHHRLTRTASKVSQVTFRDSGAVEPVMQPGFTYSDNWAGIVNSVQFSVGERTAVGYRIRVWESEETITIGASQSAVVVLQATDPFDNALTPEEGVDFTVASGGIASVSLSRTSGASTSITLTATAAGASVQGIALRAYSYPVVRTLQASASDSTSIDRYGQRGAPSGEDPVWCGRHDAKALADLYVMMRKDPLPQVNARFMCHGTQLAKLSALLGLDLSDRATVIETETVLNGPFYVEQLAHAATSILEHEVTVGLEAVPAAPTTPVFILGTSALGGSDTLGW